jgi:hypothetical protein
MLMHASALTKTRCNPDRGATKPCGPLSRLRALDLDIWFSDRHKKGIVCNTAQLFLCMSPVAVESCAAVSAPTSSDHTVTHLSQGQGLDS